MTAPGAGSGKEPAHPEAAIPLAACTIVSKNYLSLARVWDASFRKHHPEAKTFVLLVDRIEGAFDPAAEPFETIPVEDLGISAFRQLAFRYNILELNTAVKPFFLEHLLEVRGVEQLLYFDPDILVLAPLERAREALAAHPISLVPHITSPIPPDGRHPSEQDFLLSGAYNFGFLALRDSKVARQFLSWWKARVVEGAFIAPERGLFTDQKWGDLVPSLFPDAAIIGDRGYNVAYWNLQERMDVTKTPEGLRVGEVPLAFFHFSGLDFDRPEEISKHQNRYRLADLGPHYHALFREYLAMLHLAGFEKTRRWRYGFGYFDDGVAIPDFVRRLYHAEAKRAECWPDPFSSRPDGFREWILEPGLPGSPLPRLLLTIHRERADLHNAFPDREGSGARGLLRWAIESSPAEYGLGDFFTERFRQILEAIGPAELLAQTAIVGSGPRPERLHLLAIGDVSGPETYHVGDEAMLAGNLSALRRRLSNVTFTVVSRDPQWTGAHYGTRAIAPIGFPDRMRASPRERQNRLDEVLRTLATWQDTGTLAAGAAGADALRELSRADALLISGGGNLNATWPEYLYERAALIRMAHAMDRPVVVLGQTLGPHLEPDERDLLASTLPLARLVGVRERPSADLALSLGVDPSRLILQTDDAFFLDGRAVRDPGIAAELVRDARPWIVVTIHRFVPAGDGTPLESIARQLSELSRATGCRLVFVPHVGAPQDRAGESDAAFARELAARMPAAESPLLLDVLLAEEVAWLTRQAALVVSSRYHPVVFALSGGNPALGLYTDDYTRVKIEGALAHAGLERWAIPMPRALEGGLAEVGARLWTGRDAVRRSIAARQSGWKEQEEVRWRRIAETISGGEAAVISAQPNRKESGVADHR